MASKAPAQPVSKPTANSAQFESFQDGYDSLDHGFEQSNEKPETADKLVQVSNISVTDLAKVAEPNSKPQSMMSLDSFGCQSYTEDDL